MDSQILNLAYLYEDGADSTDPADSYAGRLYDLLALKDASWISGLYDLYNYTPQQLAALLGLPETAVTSTSGIIPEFRNISVHFVNSEQQETGSTSNAREIISIINTLHYFGILKDMKTMEDCADKLWNASHKYSVRIGGIYYCDGSCLDETADGRKDADESGTEAAGAVIAGSEAAGAEAVGAVIAGSQTAGAEAVEAAVAGSETTGAEAVEAAVAESETTGAEAVEAVAGSETAGAETVGTAAAGTEAVESGAAGGEPVGSMAASAAAEAETAAVASFSDASSIVSGASDAGPADSSRTCPGHVDCTVLAVVKGTAEADSLFQAADTLEAVKASGWTGWNADTRNMAGALLAQDWSQVYGLYTVDYPVKGLLNSQEIDLYMSLVPEDASRQRIDFVRYALTSVGKIP